MQYLFSQTEVKQDRGRMLCSLSKSQLVFLPWLLPPCPARAAGLCSSALSSLGAVTFRTISCSSPFWCPLKQLKQQIEKQHFALCWEAGSDKSVVRAAVPAILGKELRRSGETLRGILFCASFPQTLQQQHQFVFSFSLRMMFFLRFDTIPFMSLLSLEIIRLLIRLP